MAICRNPKVFMDPVVFADILLAIELTPIEISGLGRVERDGDVFTIVPDLAIFRQSCSLGGTHFDRESFDKDAHAGWVHEMMASPEKRELINRYRLWWHSHVYHDAVFSGVDKAQIESWSHEPDEWWLSLVGNKYGHLSMRLDQFKPVPADPVIIKDFGFTVPTRKEDMRELMLARKNAMWQIIAERIVQKESRPFEWILSGIFV